MGGHGLPLAPVLAILLMGHHEKRRLENYNLGIEFYRRYVDDTFALFNTEQDALSFFSSINSQHPNIKFTRVREENHKLPFLDVLLDNYSNQGITTSVFHKKTCTQSSLLTNCYGFVPFRNSTHYVCKCIYVNVYLIGHSPLGLFRTNINKY